MSLFAKKQAFVSVCPIFLNLFSSITTRPIEAKFHVEPPWKRGTKDSSNGPGHMTQMGTMSIYGKNIYKSSSLEPNGG